jgi:hypothetical protein
MKFDAKTIVALTGLVSVLLGGVEMRLAVNKLDDKLSRVEERVTRIERELTPRPVASLPRD